MRGASATNPSTRLRIFSNRLDFMTEPLPVASKVKVLFIDWNGTNFTGLSMLIYRFTIYLKGSRRKTTSFLTLLRKDL